MADNAHTSHEVEDTSGPANFVGRLGLVLIVLAILFAIFVLIGAATHPAVI